MKEYIDKGIALDALESKKEETEKLVLEDTHNIIKDSNRCGRLSGVSDSQKIVYDIPPANVIPIPKGATNGDMIMTMFNCMVIEISKGKVYVEGIFFPFDEEWWNAPYSI